MEEETVSGADSIVGEVLQHRELWPSLLTSFLQHFSEPLLNPSFSEIADLCKQSPQSYETNAIEAVMHLLRALPLPDWESLRLTHLLVTQLLRSQASTHHNGDDANTDNTISNRLYGTQHFLPGVLTHMQHCLQQLHEVRAMDCLTSICEGISIVAQEGCSESEENVSMGKLTPAQERLQQEAVAEKVIETLYRTFHFMTKHLHRRTESERVLVVASRSLTNLALHASQRSLLLYRSHAMETFDEILNSSYSVSDAAIIADEETLKAMFGAIRNITNAYSISPPQFPLSPTGSDVINVPSNHSSASNVLGHHLHLPAIARSTSFPEPMKVFTNLEILQHIKQLVYTLTVLLNAFQDSSMMVAEIAHTIMYLVDHVMMTQHHTATLRSNQNSFFYLECADLVLTLLKRYSNDKDTLMMVLYLVEFLQSHSAPSIPNLGDEVIGYSARPMSSSFKDISDAVGTFLLAHGSTTLGNILQENIREELLVENVMRAILTVILTYRRQYLGLPKSAMTYLNWYSHVYGKELQEALLEVKVVYIDASNNTVQHRVIADMWSKTMEFVHEVEEVLVKQEQQEIDYKLPVQEETSDSHKCCCEIM